MLYVNQNETYRLKSTARILELLACLVEHFSEPVSGGYADEGGQYGAAGADLYVCGSSLQEEMTLQEAADELGLNREYFCRFFKQSTGSSFMRYVNQVRLNYIYQDLLHTDDPVQEIMERHGFFNQKLFTGCLRSVTTVLRVRRVGWRKTILMWKQNNRDVYAGGGYKFRMQPGVKHPNRQIRHF